VSLQNLLILVIEKLTQIEGKTNKEKFRKKASGASRKITSAGTAYVLILCRFFSPYRAEKILSRH
jgi:hypothetical protein